MQSREKVICSGKLYRVDGDGGFGEDSRGTNRAFNNPREEEFLEERAGNAFICERAQPD